ncbi:MAG: MFS transporter, partial [Anaerolineaceae bacterium]|nr:MFS transporter [Anaerolineaceae bacterium]
MSDVQLTSTGLLPDGSQELDTSGRPITPRRRRWGMRVNVLCCGLGSVFAIAFWPGSVLFILYLKEILGATLTQVGLFASIAGLGQIIQLLGVFIFDRTRTRKTTWVILVVIYRLMGFVTVGFAVYAYFNPALKSSLVWPLLLVLAVAFSLAQTTATAWWSWMADLAPQSVRGRFFANRQIASTAALLLGTLPVILLDRYGKDTAGNYTETADLIFIAIFLVCTLSGVIDVVVHGFIPEPRRRDRPERPTRVRDLAIPLRNAAFRRLILTMTLLSFGAGLSVFFVWPYLINENYIGVPYRVFLFTRVLFALGMFLGSRYWGILVDRYGAKPVLAVTYSAGFVNLYVLFVTQGNAALLTCIAAVLQGLMFSGMMLAGSQLMLSLAPQKNRNVFVGVYAAVVGLGMILGPTVGGWLGDTIEAYLVSRNFPYLLPWGTVLTHMQILVAISLLWRLALYPLLLSVHEGKEKPVGVVLSTIFGLSQFRTMYARRLFAGRNKSKKARAMRRMGAGSDQLAVDDLIGQLEDAEPEIRQEAVLALGRIGGPEAVEALVRQLASPESDVRPEAAKALGMTRDPTAVGPLLEKLSDPNEIVRERAAEALGELRSAQAAQPLMDLIRSDASPNVFGRGALALAKLGVVDAIWEILPMMHRTANVALRRQLASAVGNL